MAAEACGRPRSVAGIAGHAAVGVRERGVVVRHLRGHPGILVHQLRAKRFLAEVHVAGRDAVDGLNDLPLFIFFGHRTLEYLVAAPFEPAQSPRSAERIEMASALGGGRPRGNQRGFLSNRTVAIHAIDFYGCARLTVNFSVAVIVLREVAIVALHSFLQMNVGKVDGFAQAVGVIESNLLAVLLQPISLAVVIEERAENPAVAVNISELWV